MVQSKAMLLSDLLDLHLSRSIARFKPMPDIFDELADGIEQDLQNWNDQAVELMERREKNRVRGENVFARHRDKQSTMEQRFQKMESVLDRLEGSNSKNGEMKEGSDAMSKASFPDKTGS